MIAPGAHDKSGLNIRRSHRRAGSTATHGRGLPTDVSLLLQVQALPLTSALAAIKDCAAAAEPLPHCPASHGVRTGVQLSVGAGRGACYTGQAESGLVVLAGA